MSLVLLADMTVKPQPRRVGHSVSRRGLNLELGGDGKKGHRASELDVVTLVGALSLVKNSAMDSERATASGG